MVALLEQGEPLHCDHAEAEGHAPIANAKKLSKIYDEIVLRRLEAPNSRAFRDACSL